MPDYSRIEELLKQTRAAPQMYAHDVETFLMRISTLLEVVSTVFVPRDFYITHGGKKGSLYAFKIPEGMTFDDWAKGVIDDALAMVSAYKAVDLLKLVNFDNKGRRKSTRSKEERGGGRRNKTRAKK